MNIEEPGSVWKKKPRKLIDIDVDEITLCGSAANRKKFFIKKMEDSMKDFDKAMSLVEDFTADDDLEKSKIDAQQLKEAMKTLVAFKSDLYPELKSAISIVLRWATNKKYGDTTKKSRVRVDDWPSIPIAAPSHICEKMIDRISSEDDEGAKE